VFTRGVEGVARKPRKTGKKHRIEELTDDNLLLEEQDFSLGENNVNLYSALKKLTDKQLVIIKLRYFEKLSFKEIALILNIKESNAKVKCFRAIEKLRLIYYTIE
jgi:RNA polymerase sigma-70 factor (ECF subfamily)